jgi:hypothetical protein
MKLYRLRNKVLCTIASFASRIRVLDLQMAFKIPYAYDYSYVTAFVVYWSEFLATDPVVRVRFPALPKKSNGSETGSTQPRKYNWGATW